MHGCTSTIHILQQLNARACTEGPADCTLSRDTVVWLAVGLRLVQPLAEHDLSTRVQWHTFVRLLQPPNICNFDQLAKKTCKEVLLTRCPCIYILTFFETQLYQFVN